MSADGISFKKDEIIVLLGAGASVDAGIPHSAAMVHEIESSLHNEWSTFKDLYNYVRSAIFYGQGIQGTFDHNVSYNIERLVNSLEELARREEHPIYPFIGAWNPRLSQVAGDDFGLVAQFKEGILKKLRNEWIEIQDYGRAAYYSGLLKFQKELNYPLRVFTLNYDLCVEKAYWCEYNEFPERGFGKDRMWSHEILEEAVPAEKSLVLYKLHGSIDWIRDASMGRITFSDSTAKIRPSEGVLIFGTTYKLQYVDPFLFLVYQLRRMSLDARLLIVVGYGFGDEYINGILAQALRGHPEKRIVVVSWNADFDDEVRQRAAIDDLKKFVAAQLGLPAEDDRIVLRPMKASEFLSEHLSLAELKGIFPAEESLFEELNPVSDIQLPVSPTGESRDDVQPIDSE
jgi:SIR2-like domain